MPGFSPGLRFMPFETIPFMPLEDPETGGVAKLPREPGIGGEYVSTPWYREMADHSLSATESGDRAPDGRFIVHSIRQSD